MNNVTIRDFSCPHKKCRNHRKRNKRNIVRFGHNRNGSRRFRCKTCGRTFTETRGTIFFNRKTPKKQIIKICKLLVERNGIRAIERITGVHRDTVMRLVNDLAAHCLLVTDFLIKEVELNRVEIDELWSFVKKNRKRLMPQIQRKLNMAIAGST